MDFYKISFNYEDNTYHFNACNKFQKFSQALQGEFSSTMRGYVNEINNALKSQNLTIRNKPVTDLSQLTSKDKQYLLSIAPDVTENLFSFVKGKLGSIRNIPDVYFKMLSAAVITSKDVQTFLDDPNTTPMLLQQVVNDRLHAFYLGNVNEIKEIASRYGLEKNPAWFAGFLQLECRQNEPLETYQSIDNGSFCDQFNTLEEALVVCRKISAEFANKRRSIYTNFVNIPFFNIIISDKLPDRFKGVTVAKPNFFYIAKNYLDINFLQYPLKDMQRGYDNWWQKLTSSVTAHNLLVSKKPEDKESLSLVLNAIQTIVNNANIGDGQGLYTVLTNPYNNLSDFRNVDEILLNKLFNSFCNKDFEVLKKLFTLALESGASNEEAEGTWNKELVENFIAVATDEVYGETPDHYLNYDVFKMGFDSSLELNLADVVRNDLNLQFISSKAAIDTPEDFTVNSSRIDIDFVIYTDRLDGFIPTEDGARRMPVITPLIIIVGELYGGSGATSGQTITIDNTQGFLDIDGSVFKEEKYSPDNHQTSTIHYTCGTEITRSQLYKLKTKYKLLSEPIVADIINASAINIDCVGRKCTNLDLLQQMVRGLEHNNVLYYPTEKARSRINIAQNSPVNVLIEWANQNPDLAENYNQLKRFAHHDGSKWIIKDGKDFQKNKMLAYVASIKNEVKLKVFGNVASRPENKPYYTRQAFYDVYLKRKEIETLIRQTSNELKSTKDYASKLRLITEISKLKVEAANLSSLSTEPFKIIKAQYDEALNKKFKNKYQIVDTLYYLIERDEALVDKLDKSSLMFIKAICDFSTDLLDQERGHAPLIRSLASQPQVRKYFRELLDFLGIRVPITGFNYLKWIKASQEFTNPTSEELLEQPINEPAINAPAPYTPNAYENSSVAPETEITPVIANQILIGQALDSVLKLGLNVDFMNPEELIMLLNANINNY